MFQAVGHLVGDVLVPDVAARRVRQEYQGHELGALRIAAQRHMGLARRLGSLAQVAALARAHDILPGRFPTAHFGRHMVDGETSLGGLGAAILARIVVSEHDRAACQGDVQRVGNTHIVDQTNH